MGISTMSDTTSSQDNQFLAILTVRTSSRVTFSEKTLSF